MLITIACATCAAEHNKERKEINAAIRKRGAWICVGCAQKQRRLDLVGERFGRLVVLEMLDPDKHQKTTARCVCDCGRLHIAEASSIKRGTVKSCGCLLSESRGDNTKTHGLSDTRTYRIWMAMRARCKYKSVTSYPLYGGRGVRVCDRWESFERFVEDMGEAPDDAQIDRIDNDGNYEPSNCRWATRHQQARNKSTNRNIEYNGVRKCLKDWAGDLQIDQASLAERISKWGVERALSTPKGR